MGATSAYIHIPFCRRRCFYCDFAISVVGERRRGGSSLAMSTYVKSLIEEIAATPYETEKQPPLRTVFFGGGTPSLLEPSQIASLLRALLQRFGIAPTAEISMELDPATFTLAHLQGYRAAGINRVSLGAQSFDDEQLAAAGRFHRRADILDAIALIQRADLTNYSLDLICGLPHQSLDSYQQTLEAALALNPAHVSVYDLIVEPQTAFAQRYTPGESPLPSDRATAAMYRHTQSRLQTAGYEHYEICNYAKPGRAAQHNLTYWRCQSHYGFGMGATSYLNHQRIDRPRTQKTYRRWLDQYIAAGGQTSDPILSPEERVLETVMMGLRLPEGIALGGVYRVFGQAGLAALQKALSPHVEAGWLRCVSDISDADSTLKLGDRWVDDWEAQHRICLSDPEGFLMSNQVIIDAFNALEALQPAVSSGG